jgi:predicted AAA+ superfamily ATPase
MKYLINALDIVHIRSYISIMQTYVPRAIETQLSTKLTHYPAVAILGPRQCGKSTLAKQFIAQYPNSLYLDLERPSHLNMLQDPEAFFELNTDKLLCLDEIQRTPDIFTILRSVIDARASNGQFLLLGSASPDLIKQSSETLAGRIAYLELTPFLLNEVAQTAVLPQLRTLWLQGGFPRSYLAPDEDVSFEWREDFITTFLERDLPQLGVNLSASLLRRFWQMCAHLHGQLLNTSKLGESLGVSYHTVRSYIDLLEHTFILRVLRPLETNLKKRLIKSPKIYIRDPGLLHALLMITSHNTLLGHPIYGASWEGFVLEQILANFPDWQPFFYRTATGNEIDLILEKGGRRVAVECKVSTAPQVSKGWWHALEDLNIQEAWIIAPVQERYPLKRNMHVCPLGKFIELFNQG